MRTEEDLNAMIADLLSVINQSAFVPVPMQFISR